MKKLWIIIIYQYLRLVLRRRFFITLLAPLATVVLIFVIMFLVFQAMISTQPVGYVNPSQTAIQESTPSSSPPGRGISRLTSIMNFFYSNYIELVPFHTEEEARAALQARKVQAYFILPPDYPKNREVTLIFQGKKDAGVEAQVIRQMRAFLLSKYNLGSDRMNRLMSGPIVLNQEYTNPKKLAGLVDMSVPFLYFSLIMMCIFMTSDSLVESVAEEKENRMMEVLVTSAPTWQILIGKIIAILSVSITQSLIWFLPVLGFGLFVLISFSALLALPINYALFALMGLLAVLTIALVSAIIIILGVIFVEAKEGQAVSAIIGLFLMMPLLLYYVLMRYPDGPIAILLTFFPLTTGLTLLIRIGFTTVPAWQVALSIALLIGFTIFNVWLSGRIFRAGMLLYDQNLSLKEMFCLFRLGNLIRRSEKKRWKKGTEVTQNQPYQEEVSR